MAENTTPPLFPQEDHYNHALDQALCEAAEAGRYEEALDLLHRGADPNGHSVRVAFEFYGGDRTYMVVPLEQAVRGEHIEMMRILLEAGAVPYYGMMFSVNGLKQRSDAIKILLEYGLDVNQMGALLAAVAARGDYATVSMLLDHGVKIGMDGFGYGALLNATEKGYIEIVELLLRHGVEVNPHDTRISDTALMTAAEHGHTAIVALLLSQGADVKAINADQETALLLAVKNNHLDAARLLLQAGAETEVNNRYDHGPLNLVCRDDNQWNKRARIDFIRLLLEFGANPNGSREGRSYHAPLLDAVIINHEEAVQLLLQRGADSDARNYYGSNGLFYAVKYHYRKMVDMLLEAGAHLDGIGSALGEDLELGRMLLERGADPNAATPVVSYGYSWEGCCTPLLRAAERGDLALVQLLLDRGAEIDRAGWMGYTALMFAVMPNMLSNKANPAQHVLVAQYLLEQGADVTARDQYGKTALDLAHIQNRYKFLEAEPLIALLETYGAPHSGKQKPDP